MTERTNPQGHYTPPSDFITCDELATYLSKTMINRDDTYATFSQEMEVCEQTPQIINECLTEDIIKRHLNADNRSDLIAIHTRSKENTCRFAMIDIQRSDCEKAPHVWEQVLGISYLLQVNGINPIFSESLKYGRYNLWIIFKRPVPADQLIRFGDALLASCRHRTPTREPCLQLDQDGLIDGRDFLTKPNRINVYPRSLHGETDEEFVLLPCLMENSFDYFECYPEHLFQGERMFMGGSSLTDNSFELKLNEPNQIDPENFKTSLS